MSSESYLKQQILSEARAHFGSLHLVGGKPPLLDVIFRKQGSMYNAWLIAYEDLEMRSWKLLVIGSRNGASRERAMENLLDTLLAKAGHCRSSVREGEIFNSGYFRAFGYF